MSFHQHTVPARAQGRSSVNSATFSSFPRSAFRPKGLICKDASGASLSANAVDDFMSKNMKIRSSSTDLWYFPVG
jgi:hypothetical protein